MTTDIHDAVDPDLHVAYSFRTWNEGLDTASRRTRSKSPSMGLRHKVGHSKHLKMHFHLTPPWAQPTLRRWYCHRRVLSAEVTGGEQTQRGKCFPLSRTATSIDQIRSLVLSISS
jgi:hypothetical protein